MAQFCLFSTQKRAFRVPRRFRDVTDVTRPSPSSRKRFFDRSTTSPRRFLPFPAVSRFRDDSGTRYATSQTFPCDIGLRDFTAEEILKFQKYEADYACRLRAKYFSNKDIYGGDIFEVTVPVGNEIIKASRWPPTQSYADPKQSFVGRSSIEASGAETSPIVANGNTTPPRSSS